MVDTPESSALLNELVEDAKRVAAYGQRTGRLKDSNLVGAIAAVERLPNRTWASPEIVALQTYANAALQALSPTNLADLRGTWDPYDPRGSLKQLLFVFATLVLMAMTAFATFEYNRGVTLLKSAEDIQQENPRAEIGSIARQLLAVKVVADSQPKSAILDETHFALIDRLHEIDSRLTFLLPQTSEFRKYHQLPHETIGSLFASASDALASLFGLQQAKAKDTTPTGQSDLPASGTEACAKRGQAMVQYATLAGTPVARSLTDNLNSVLDIVCVAGLAYPPTIIPSYAKFISDVGSWTNIWGRWYLPALYGALGAMLYYMRRILDPTIPDPPSIRILHRTALGAFSGVIITWFWAPNAELSEGVSNVGLTLFTLAFLIGFGIEVLFALLDRIVSALIDLAKGVGDPPPPPPAPTTN